MRPRARRDHVGGCWGPDDALVVTVQQPAVDGRANDALVKLLAEALDRPRRDVTIVSGLRSRTKLIEITGPDAETERTLERLRRGG